MSSVLDRYTEEIKEDLDINQFNVKEVQMRSPARKHFWVARLVNTKIQFNKLKAKKKDLKYEIIGKIIQKAPTKMTQIAVDNAAENSDQLKAINEKLSELEVIIEYLEHVVKIMNNIHWEIKNIIDLMQMEMQ